MTSHSNHDTDENRLPTTDKLTGNDEIDFQLDIVDGENPSRPVTDDGVEFNTYPPGPGPMPGTMRFIKTIDNTWTFIERGNFGGWISAAKTISLEDTR